MVLVPNHLHEHLIRSVLVPLRASEHTRRGIVHDMRRSNTSPLGERVMPHFGAERFGELVKVRGYEGVLDGQVAKQ